MRFAKTLMVLALALTTACATAPTKPVDPEQQAELDRQYQELLEARMKIQAETAKYSGDSNALYLKASNLERQLKLTSKESRWAWSGQGRAVAAGVLGPISFDKKSASFKLTPGKQSGKGILLYLCLEGKGFIRSLEGGDARPSTSWASRGRVPVPPDALPRHMQSRRPPMGPFFLRPAGYAFCCFNRPFSYRHPFFHMVRTTVASFRASCTRATSGRRPLARRAW